MPFKIQRVPRGLNELMSIFGGQTPVELEDRVRACVEMMQLYGMQQVQARQAVNAALPEGTVVPVTVPANETWVLFQFGFSIAKTSTMTACSLSLQLGPPGGSIAVKNVNLQPFGATDVGTVIDGIVMPYPRLMLPGWSFMVRLDILGTDATANVTCGGLVGILG